jgi:hypothetical protein
MAPHLRGHGKNNNNSNNNNKHPSLAAINGHIGA